MHYFIMLAKPCIRILNSSKTYPHPYEITNIISKTWILNYFVAFIGSDVNVCITQLPGENKSENRLEIR